MGMGPQEFVTPAIVKLLLVGSIEKVNFNFGPYQIRSSMYADVANCIASRRLEVVYDLNLGDVAKYDPVDDKMCLGFTNVSKVSNSALIVHEATHAICDYQHAGINRATSEALAYLAQAFFFQIGRPHEYLDDPCLRAAAAVLSWRDQATGVINAPVSAVEKLRDAIVAGYSNALTYRPQYNGIRYQ